MTVSFDFPLAHFLAYVHSDFPMRVHMGVAAHDAPYRPALVALFTPNECANGVARFVNHVPRRSDRKVNVTGSTVPQSFAVPGAGAPSKPTVPESV